MAINYIDKKSDYLQLKAQSGVIFKLDRTFPENLFQPDYACKLFFENGVEDMKEFYESLVGFMKEIGDKKLIFLTISPDPETYFFKYFKKYSAASFSINESYDSFIKFLEKDPGDSPADALAFNSMESVVFSESRSWGIITSKSYEMGVVGFKGKDVYNRFKYHFYNNNFCLELPEYIDYWRGIFDGKELPSVWLEFEKNYGNS